MLQRFSENKRKGVAWLLLFLLCFSLVDIPVEAKAEAVGELKEMGLYDDDHNPKTNEFMIFGRHHYTDGAVWTWNTRGFTVANKECSDVTNPPEGVKTARLNITKNLSTLEIYQMNMYTISTYHIDGDDFANAFQKLYAEEIESAGDRGEKTYTNSMYFNNIFQVVYRTNPGIIHYYSGAEMHPVYSFNSASKGEEYFTAAQLAANPYYTGWDASMFTKFYNYEYEFTVTLLEAKINYVDKKTGKDLVTGVASKYGLLNGTGRYTLPEKTITVDGKSYVSDGTYTIDYKTGATPQLAPIMNGSCSWTFSNDGMEIDIYFKEDATRTKVPVVINLQTSPDGRNYTTAKSFPYGSEVLSKEKFTYTPDAMYKDSENNTYNYTKKWYYTYTDLNGAFKEVTTVSGETPKIDSVPQVKAGTSLNVYVRYDMEKPPEIVKNKDVKVRINTQVSDTGASYSNAATTNYGTLQTGAAFNYNPSATYTFNAVKYNYINQWYYTYVNSEGNNITELPESDKPSIAKLPEVKKDTYLDVYTKYVKITPTPTVSPPPTGTPTAGPRPTSTPPPGPTAAPKPTATSTPTPTPTPAKRPSSDQTAPENLGRHWKDIATPESIAGIRAEEENGNRYDVTVGIPTQEDLYTFGHATSYMFGYDVAHMTGTKTYPVKVDKKYILKWREGTEEEDADGDGVEEGEDEEKPEPEILTEEVTLTTYIYVTRCYGYWEIESFEMYVPDTMTLYNYALPGGSVTMTVKSSKMNPVELNISVTDYDDNITAPAAAMSGIVLPDEVVESWDNKKPEIPREDFETLAFNAAHSRTGNIKVRNDSLVYRNIAVLDAAERESIALAIKTYPLEWSEGDVTADLFHAGNMVIDAKKDNGVYYSSGAVTYKAMPVNVGGEWTKTYPLTYEPNNVLIHTPVLCKAVVSSDNNKYVQLSSPLNGADVHHLVLDENGTLNDFTVSINNYGEHLSAHGYLTRDYRKIKRLPDSDLSNIERGTRGLLRNEVKFQFDVYMDVGNDYDTSNDVFYPAGTWFVLGEYTQRFYLPLTVKEGFYGADFRTVAVNANGRLTLTQERRNTIWHNYVATDSALFEVSGRVYGLNVYDISDYPIWEEVFRIPGQLHLKINKQDTYPLGVNDTKYSKNKSYNYTVGTKDRYGSETGRDRKYTLPLVGGSHPYYGNIGILKRGYTVRFSLDTIGAYYDDSAKVIATPAYYWVDKDGRNRTKVDMYYSAEVAGKSRSLIKSGESIDLANTVKYTAGDRKLGVPEEELSITAAIRNLLLWKWEWQRDTLVIGTSRTEMGYVFRTFTGNSYAKRILTGPNKTRVMNAGITEADLTVTKQSWYGETFIPGTAMFVEEGTDVFGYAKRYGIDYTESFWKKDGYIIMNLDIRVYDGNGKARLSYVNKPNEALYCNMWRLEGALISKSSEGKTAFYFEDGDFMIYSVEQSAINDYVVGGIY